MKMKSAKTKAKAISQISSANFSWYVNQTKLVCILMVTLVLFAMQGNMLKENSLSSSDKYVETTCSNQCEKKGIEALPPVFGLRVAAFFIVSFSS